MKGPTDALDLVGEMRHLKESDRNSVACFGFSEFCLQEEADEVEEEDPMDTSSAGQVQSVLDYLFFQTTEMRELLEKFAELLGMDTTYNINRHHMHLIVYLVVDNHGNGRIVAYCFIRRETKDMMGAAMTHFKEANESAASRLRTVIIDKDYKEVAIVNNILPHVHVHLCHTHVMRVFERKTRKEEDPDGVMKHLRALSLSESRAKFEELYEKLIAVASKDFKKYFDDNWKDIEEAWVLHVRQESLSLGVRSTNYVESHNAQIDKICSKCNSIADGVRSILLLHRNREFESSYKDFLAKGTKAYLANNKDPNVQLLLDKVCDWGAKLLIKELEKAQSLPEDLDDMEDRCQCNFQKMFGMNHCSHIFSLKEAKGMTINL